MMNDLILGIDYIEFYVSNLPQAVHFYKTTLGFTPIAYRTYENSISTLLKQNDIHLILTSSKEPDEISADVNKHGDGIKDIALATVDINHSFKEAVRFRANAILPPTLLQDDNGNEIKKAIVSVFGDTHHSLIERKEKSEFFLPNFTACENVQNQSESGLISIDHLAICLKKGSLEQWSKFYQEAFGFYEFFREDLMTKKSGMNSIVVQNKQKNCLFTLLEPVSGSDKSQIENFLDYYQGEGVQHIAFLSSNIIHSVELLQRKGLEFLSIPSSYYQALPERIQGIKNLKLIEKLQILVDRDKDGLLFQIFSKVIQTRPTFFIEIIQREGSKSFGSGNIRALFEAIEKEEAEE